MRAGHVSLSAWKCWQMKWPTHSRSNFAIVFNEQNFGMSVDAALKNLQVRVPSVESVIFVSAVLRQKENRRKSSNVRKLWYIYLRERFRLKLKVALRALIGGLRNDLSDHADCADGNVKRDCTGLCLQSGNDPVGKYLIVMHGGDKPVPRDSLHPKDHQYQGVKMTAAIAAAAIFILLAARVLHRLSPVRASCQVYEQIGGSAAQVMLSPCMAWNNRKAPWVV